MNIDELTIGQARELTQLFARQSQVHPYRVGRNYLVRTVTMTLYGKLVAVFEQELILQDAAWIADSGRWADALESGEFDEVEPFPDGDVIVGRGAIIDAVALSFPPKRQQK